MKNISILGSGWLGLSLARELSKNYHIKISTTTVSKIQRLKVQNITPYIVNIDDSIFNDEFLNSDILIINIPSKNIEAFSDFVEKLELSYIKKVIFISSTSVYKSTSKENTLLKIESFFTSLKNMQTTILRFAGLIGYDRNLVKHFQTKIVSNSKSLVNMVHRDDCISIINQVIQKDIDSEVFDCCASTHPTKEDFYTYYAKVSEYNLPQFDNKKGNDKVIDNQKLKDILAYEFIYDDLLNIKYYKELSNYLEETPIINFSNKEIQTLAKKLSKNCNEDEDIAKKCFLYVRDNIKHIGDIKEGFNACKASDVLKYKTALCYGKAHLLAALLRANNIPTGLCYQRLNCNEYIEGSYCVHGLNAIYLKKYGWYRVDARGNKEGVDAQFTPPYEKLAFDIEEGEYDIEGIFDKPLAKVIKSLAKYKTYEEIKDNIPDIE